MFNIGNMLNACSLATKNTRNTREIIWGATRDKSTERNGSGDEVEYRGDGEG